MGNITEVSEGTQYQSPDEQLVYSITTTPWGSTPDPVVIAAYDEYTNTDVTSTVIPGDESVTGDVITLPALKALTLGHSYRIDVKFTDDDSNVWECYFIVKCVER